MHIMNNVSILVKMYRPRAKLSTLTIKTVVHCVEHNAKEDLIRIKHLRNAVKGNQIHSFRGCLTLAIIDV